MKGTHWFNFDLLQGDSLDQQLFQLQSRHPHNKFVFLEIYVQITDKCYEKMAAAGTLVKIDGRLNILTACHNIYDTNRDQYHFLMNCYFARNECTRELPKRIFIFIQPSQKNCKISEKYKDNKIKNKQNYQMALIDDINDYIGTNALPSEFLPKGELEIYFDWKNRSYEEIEKQIIYQSNYNYTPNVKLQFLDFPDYKSFDLIDRNLISKSQIQNKFNDKSSIILNSSILLYNNEKYNPGHDGSAILIKTQNNWAIVGIHIGRSKIKEQLDIFNNIDFSFSIGLCININEVAQLLYQPLKKFIKNQNQINQIQNLKQIQIYWEHGIHQQLKQQKKNLYQPQQFDQANMLKIGLVFGSQFNQVSSEKQMQFPFNKFVCLKIQYTKNNKKIKAVGSGTLIRYKNNFFVLTAAHNLYNVNLKKYYQKVTCIFCKRPQFIYRPKPRITISLNSDNCKINKKYLSQQVRYNYKTPYQIALIDINEEVEKIEYINGVEKKIKDQLPKGELDIQYYWKQHPYQIIQNTKIRICGYSKSKQKEDFENKKQMYTQGTPMKKQQVKFFFSDQCEKALKSKNLFYMLSTNSGHSGSAITAKINSRQVIVGIHIGSQPKNQIQQDDQAYYNLGLCFSGEKCLNLILNINQNSFEGQIQQDCIDQNQELQLKIQNGIQQQLKDQQQKSPDEKIYQFLLNNPYLA